MGGVVSGIAETISNVGRDVGNAIGGDVGQVIGTATTGAFTGTGLLGGIATNALTDSMKPGKKSEALERGARVNPALDRYKAEQQAYAEKFQKELPQMQAKMAQDLSRDAHRRMTSQIRETNQGNFSRGLGYGGVNEGQKQAVRSESQSQLAGKIAGANASLENASNTLNAQAVETGLGVQQTQQQIQNQIYQQQLSNQQAQNAITGSITGAGLLAGLNFLKGGA